MGRDFLAAAITATGSATLVHGTDFTSSELKLPSGYSPFYGVIVAFTRVTGAASTLDVDFQVSFDDGTTWASYDDAQIQVATNHAAISGNLVKYYTMMALHGVTHIRLYSVKNNWATDCTVFNVTLLASGAK